jgi:hypothetical protein
MSNSNDIINTITKFKPYLPIEVGYQHYNFTDKTEDVLFIPNTN